MRKWDSCFLAGLILIGVSSLAVYIRIQTVSILGDDLFLGTDSYRFAKRARMILKEGKLPPHAPTAWLPQGRDLTDICSPFSLEYLLAYACRIFSAFNPKISLHSVIVYYPVVTFVMILILSFLICIKLFGLSYGVLSLMLLSLCPGILDRTVAGFSDRDALVLFLAMLSYTFYIFSFYHSDFRRRIFLLSSGIVMGILGLIWKGAGIFIIIPVMFNLVRWGINGWGWDDFKLYLWWVIPMEVILTVATNRYRHDLLAGYSSVTILFPFLPLLLASYHSSIAYILRSRFKRRVYRIGVIAGISLITVILILTLWEKIEMIGQNTLENFFYPFGLSRHFLLVAELQPSTTLTWFQSFSFFFLLFVCGLMLITHRICHTLGLNPWLVGGAVLFLIGSVLYVRLPFGRIILNPIAAEALYIGSLSLMLLILIVVSIQRRIKRVGLWLEPKEQGMFLLALWSIEMLCLTRSANRFMIFLTPPVIFIGSYPIYELYRKAVRTEDLQVFLSLALTVVLWQLSVLNIVNSLLVILPLMFLPVGFSCFRFFRRTQAAVIWKMTHMVSGLLLIGALGGFLSIPNERIGTGWTYLSWERARSARPVLKKEWRDALYWARDNLPKNAIIAAWWIYGSQINWLSGKGTVVDEDTLSEYRIHLLARHLFCGQSFEEALQILKTYGVTHLAVSKWELRNQDLLSFLGSDSEYDRLSPLVNLKETDRIYTGEKVIVKLKPMVRSIHGSGLKLDKLKEMLERRQEVEFAVVEFYRRDNSVINGFIKFKEYEKSLPVRIWYEGKPIESGGNFAPGLIYLKKEDGIWAGAFLPKLLAESTIVRLFLLGEGSRYFKLVYENPAVKIWEVKYPDDIPTEERYLNLKFPEGELYKSWKLKGL